MAGKSLAELGYSTRSDAEHVSVKESVFPFINSPASISSSGPEMRSTGEVMGIERAVLRWPLPRARWRPARSCRTTGTIFISVADRKNTISCLARRLEQMGFELIATRGTARGWRMPASGRSGPKVAGRPPQPARLHGQRPHATGHQHAQRQGRPDRRGTNPRSGRLHGHPLYYDHQAAEAAVRAMEAMREEEMTVQAVQDRFPCSRKNSHPSSENRP